MCSHDTPRSVGRLIADLWFHRIAPPCRSAGRQALGPRGGGLHCVQASLAAHQTRTRAQLAVAPLRAGVCQWHPPVLQLKQGALDASPGATRNLVWLRCSAPPMGPRTCRPAPLGARVWHEGVHDQRCWQSPGRVVAKALCAAEQRSVLWPRAYSRDTSTGLAHFVRTERADGERSELCAGPQGASSAGEPERSEGLRIRAAAATRSGLGRLPDLGSSAQGCARTKSSICCAIGALALGASMSPARMCWPSDSL